MKRNLVLLCVILAAFFLAMACGGDDGEKETPPDTTPTVTFDRNADGDEGEEANPKVMKVNKSGILSSLPRDPTRPGWFLKEWNMEPDGSGETYNRREPITASITVYAIWLENGTPVLDEDGNIFVKYPKFTPVSANGVRYNPDDNTYAFLTGNESWLDYKFPTDVGDGHVSVLTYDYFIIEVSVLSGETGNVTSVYYRTFGTTNTYGGVWSSPANRMPWLSNPDGKKTILEVGGAGSTGGFRLFGPAATVVEKVRIDSITFYKGPRFTVTFNYNDGGATQNKVVSDVWGKDEEGNHPGRGVSASDWPATPSYGSKYFAGWYDESATPPVSVKSDVSIDSNKTFTAHWRDTQPQQVEYIIVNNGSAVPVYRFTIPDGWADANKGVSKLSYTIYVASGAIANRMHVLVPLTGFTAAGVLSMPSGWGDYRLINVEDGGDVNGILRKGKDADGAEGTTGKWVTYEWVIGPAATDVTTANNPNAKGVLTTKYGDIPTAANAKVYIGLGLSSNANTVSYYIKDVKLILADGSTIDNDDIDTLDGGTTGAKLGNFYFTSNSSNTVVRSMDFEP